MQGDINTEKNVENPDDEVAGNENGIESTIGSTKATGDPESSVAHDTTRPLENADKSAGSDIQQSNERLDALVRDRDTLRAEVTDMRKSLEEIQTKHHADMEALQEKLDDAESKKEHAETQFQKLLERVNTIKSQLGERLREDAVCSTASSRTPFHSSLNLG